MSRDLVKRIERLERRAAVAREEKSRFEFNALCEEEQRFLLEVEELVRSRGRNFEEAYQNMSDEERETMREAARLLLRKEREAEAIWGVVEI